MFLSTIIALAIGAAPEAQEINESPRVVVARHKDSGRRLRADFAPPDSVALVDSRLWPRATAAMLEALEERVPTILLQEEWRLDDDWRLIPEENGDALMIDVRLESGWIRDYGPLQVETRDGIRWLNAGYYTDRPADDDLPLRLAGAFGVRTEQLPIALEGGGIISNGAGLCVSTTMSIERAAIDLDDTAYVDALADSLGCRAWAIVPALKNDGTGHVDMFAQFVSKERVLVSSLDRARAPDDARRLDEAVRLILKAGQALGQVLDVRRVPMPIDVEGRYLTYVNGTRIKGAFLTPSYTDAPDDVERRAYRAITRAIGGDEIIAIPADELISLGGAVHCTTLGLSFEGRLTNKRR